ncbi:MAG: SusC/RagA family TonB-linked outer membrane protein [Ferruginibacter sp.]|nr:SusC/RagA family TonB-linked outer membrane protein [Ferruginibacter sp.]
MLPAMMRKSAMLLLAIFGLTSLALSQTQTVTGTVTDKKGEPLPGVTVAVKNSIIATSTNAQGAYTLKNVPQEGILVLTGAGVVTREVNVSGNSIVNADVETSVGNLNEVVVVGYGTARRKDITGSVAKLSSASFNQGSVTNGIEALQGKVAGVAITPAGGDPNGKATIRIRGIGSIQGNSDPLVVVDGVQGIDLNTIPPTEIESFDILKDASATAIYGSRGANGVVLVTTKKGRSGAPKLEYNSFVATEKVANTIDLMSPSDVRAYFAKNNPLLDGGASTDWVKAISRSAFTHNHSLAVSGGTDKSNYRGAVTYFNREGVLLNSGKDNINARLSINQKAINNKLDIQLNAIYNVSNRRFIDYGSDITNITVSGVGQESLNPFLFAYSMNPTNPIYNSSATNPYGGYFQPNQYASQNPVAFLEQIYNRGRENNFIGSARLEYSLTRSLKVFVFGSQNKINTVNDFHSPTTAYNTSTGYAKKGNINEDNLLGNAGLNYRKTAGKHIFEATGVYEYFENIKDEFSVAVRDLRYDNVRSNNLSLGSTVDQGFPKSNKESYNIVSFLGRVNYNYEGKYFLTASVRRDGSSKLGANYKWGTFPSVSAAWTISKEGFMDGTKGVLDDLKLRVGYGITGNQNGITPSLSQKLTGFGSPTLVNGNVVTPIVNLQNANSNLRWERKAQLNAGLDFALLKNVLTGSVDFYSGKTTDLLYEFGVDRAVFDGVDKLVANAGELTNRGVEIQLNSLLIKRTSFQLNVSGNISFNTNKIVNLDGEASDRFGATVKLTQPNRVSWGSIYGRGLSFSNVTFLEPGYPMGTMLVPHFTGKDAQGNPLIESEDINKFRRFNPLPKFTYGFSISPRYKNLDAAINFRGSQGGKIYNGTLTNLDNEGRLADGDNVYAAAVSHGFKKPQISDYFVESGSFLRLDNLAVGYNVPVRNISVIKNVRVFAAGNNLFIITKYKGTDPEVAADGKNLGIENINVYPKNRTFSFGLNVGF